MEKTSIEQLVAIKEFLKQTNEFGEKSIEQIRKELADTAQNRPPLPNMKTDKVTLGHIHGEWLSPANPLPINDDQTILYFHGGGFVAGTCEFYRDLASRISQASGAKVLTFEYRLAPEHPYPAANEDCLSAYQWLLDNGYSAQNIVFGGDSVGGSLVLMTLLSLRDAGEAMPAGVFLLSPHTDLVHLDGESYQSRSQLDPMGSMQSNQRILDVFLNNWQGEKPALLSPLRMDVSGLPSLLIQAGDHEVLLSDALRFTDHARASGIEVTLEVWENMWSVFQLFAHMLPEAQQAIMNIGQFVRTKFNHTQLTL